MEWIVYVSVGAVSGFLAGLLGIGGGMVIVPAMLFALPIAGVSGPELMKISVATSLAIVIPTAVASAQAHAARGSVSWTAFVRLAPGVIVGAMAGAALAAHVDALIVSLVFIAFALHTAVRMIRGARRAAAAATDPLPGVMTLSVKGLCIGALASLLGVAGAALVIAVLSRHVEMTRAIGTAAITGLPLAVASVIGYGLASQPAGCPQGCVGYVFLPAVGAVGVAAVLTVPWGARVAHALPVATLKRVFGGLLLLVAGNLAYKTLPILSNDARALEFSASDAVARLTEASAAVIGRPVVAAAAPGQVARAEAAMPPAWLEHWTEKGDRLDLVRQGEAASQFFAPR